MVASGEIESDRAQEPQENDQAEGGREECAEAQGSEDPEGVLMEESERYARLCADRDSAMEESDRLRAANAALRGELEAERRLHDADREDWRTLNKDYREKAAKLHELQDPNRREGREGELIRERDALKLELFDTQAKLRQAKADLELLNAIPADVRRKNDEHAAALLNMQLESERMHQLAADRRREDYRNAPALFSADTGEVHSVDDYYARISRESQSAAPRSKLDRLIDVLAKAIDGSDEDDF